MLQQAAGFMSGRGRRADIMLYSAKTFFSVEGAELQRPHYIPFPPV